MTYMWAISGGKILTLSVNDYLEIWGSCSVSNRDFNLQIGASFSVIKI